MAVAVKEKKDVAVRADWECPICAKNPPFSAKLMASIEECRAMRAGKIPEQNYTTLEEMLEDLNS